jgi:hypothetical protein
VDRRRSTAVGRPVYFGIHPARQAMHQCPEFRQMLR